MEEKDVTEWVLNRVEEVRQKDGDEAADAMLLEWRSMQMLNYVHDVIGIILKQRQIARLQEQIAKLRSDRPRIREHLEALGKMMPDDQVDQLARDFLATDRMKNLHAGNIRHHEIREIFQEFVKKLREDAE